MTAAQSCAAYELRCQRRLSGKQDKKELTGLQANSSSVGAKLSLNTMAPEFVMPSLSSGAVQLPTVATTTIAASSDWLLTAPAETEMMHAHNAKSTDPAQPAAGGCKNCADDVGFLKMSLFNARSIKNKLQELQYYLTNESPDILCITESWLLPSCSDSIVVGDCNFTLVRKDKSWCCWWWCLYPTKQ